MSKYDTEIAECDGCGKDMVIFKDIMNMKTEKGLCTDCVNEPITTKPLNSDKPHHVVGMPAYKAYPTNVRRLFEFIIDDNNASITILMRNREDVPGTFMYFPFTCKPKLAFDVFLINAILYTPKIRHTIYGPRLYLKSEVLGGKYE